MEAGSISGGWLLQRVLGSGGRVGVWGRLPSAPAVPPTAPTKLAVKVCRFPREGLADVQRQLWREQLHLLSGIDHENVAKCLHLPSDLAAGLVLSNPSGLPPLCLQFTDMGDLRRLLDDPENANGLREADLRTSLRDIGAALSYLHSSHITHRNLKPENVLLYSFESSYGSDFTCKITDLEYAARSESASALANPCGSSYYWPPEYLHSKPCSVTVDYWSLGIMAFEMACGIRPFLPESPVVLVANQIKNKGRDDICAYEDIDGNVHFSERIYDENRLSLRLKCSLDKWLRSILQYDPQKRGHFDNDDSEKHRTVIATNVFDSLDKILSAKIITLFSVPTYEYLSYEIDKETTFITFQNWIERDTRINIEDQIFLSSETSGRVDVDIKVEKYWKREPSVTLYLYRRNSFVDNNVLFKPSSKLRQYMEKPKATMNYGSLLRALVEIYDFLSKECDLYASLSMALALQLRHLKNEIKTLYEFFVKSEKDMCRLDEKYHLLTDIIDIDKKRNENTIFKESNPYSVFIETWIKEANVLKENVSKLTDAWNQLTIRLESASRRCNEVYDNEIDSKRDCSRLIELKNSSNKLVISIKRASKDERSKPKSRFEGVKLLFESFKLRDTLLFGTENKKLMQKILNINDEVKRMFVLILSAGKNALTLSQNISSQIINKQNDMWNFLMDNGAIDNKTIKKNDGNSKFKFEIGKPVRNPKPVVQEDNFELNALINNNKKLRKCTEDFINISRKSHREIQSEVSDSLILLEAEILK